MVGNEPSMEKTGRSKAQELQDALDSLSSAIDEVDMAIGELSDPPADQAPQNTRPDVPPIFPMIEITTKCLYDQSQRLRELAKRIRSLI